jgi:hypothetical protein
MSDISQAGAARRTGRGALWIVLGGGASRSRGSTPLPPAGERGAPSSAEEWEPFSEPWPRAGMTRSGIAYRRPTLAPRTYGTGFGQSPTHSIPTPTARTISSAAPPRGGAELFDQQERLSGPMGAPLAAALARVGPAGGRAWDAEPQLPRVADGSPADVAA